MHISNAFVKDFVKDKVRQINRGCPEAVAINILIPGRGLTDFVSAPAKPGRRPSEDGRYVRQCRKSGGKTAALHGHSLCFWLPVSKMRGLFGHGVTGWCLGNILGALFVP